MKTCKACNKDYEPIVLPIEFPTFLGNKIDLDGVCPDCFIFRADTSLKIVEGFLEAYTAHLARLRKVDKSKEWAARFRNEGSV